MRKTIFLAFILFPFAFCAAADTAPCDAAYKEGRFEAALNCYKALAEDNKAVAPKYSFLFFNSAARDAAAQKNAYLYYNIGNCYYKLGYTGFARAYYTKAFDLKPRDAAVRHNLQKSMEGAGQTLVPAGMPAALHKLIYFLSVYEIQRLMTVLFLLGACLFCFWFFKRKGGALAAAVCALLLLCGAWYGLRTRGMAERAVVVAARAEARSGPGASFPAEAIAPQAYGVNAEDASGEWVYITSDNEELSGWVDKNSVLKIEEI